jgi:dsDNA-specific endonuclease/ATPase MutS2
VRQARAEAERLVKELHDDVRVTRRALERETLTAQTIDEALGRADARLAQLPELETVAPAPVRAPSSWRVGDRVRSRSQGWEGRIAALERGGRRATLESGGMRVSVEVDDLSRSCPQSAAKGGLRRVQADGRAPGQG